MIVAAVIGRAAWNEVRKLLGTNEVAPPHFQTIEIKMPRDLLDSALESKIGRRLAEATHGLLHGLVGSDRNGAVLHAVDAIGADNGADGFSKLEGRAPGIGADVVECAQLQRTDDAALIEGHLHVEIALGAVAIPAAHVLQAVFDQPHRKAEPA